MIYSHEIDKKCAVCRFAELGVDETVYCVKKKKTLPLYSDACKKFSYDILKRSVHRRKKLETNFNPEDFIL